MISVICVYNKIKIFNTIIKDSLEKQTVKYELIALDNINGDFKSAAGALNHGADRAMGKYLMFVHQDIKLLSERWLENVEKKLDTISNFGVAGIAGRSREYKSIISNIKHGVPPDYAGKVRVKEIEGVQTLDECLIIVNKEVFKKYCFDEKICKSWHLYAVDLSLTLKREGYKNIVLPFPAHHLSIGHKPMSKIRIALNLGMLPKDYYNCLKYVINKHRDSYKVIYTTCGVWNTSQSILLQRIVMTVEGFLKIIYWICVKVYRYFFPKKSINIKE